METSAIPTTAITTGTVTTSQDHSSCNSKIIGESMSTSGHFHHQFHHNQSAFSHVLSSPTSTTMECLSPLGGTQEIPGFPGKLTASSSFSGSSTRSMNLSHHGSKQPLQDSEDSSYDSDCEVSDATTSHNDVSRTVSDTLEQEFKEYVTLSSRGQQTALACGVISGPGASVGAETFQVCGQKLMKQKACMYLHFLLGEAMKLDDNWIIFFLLQFNTDDPSYKSKLDFAKKLGYTETQVQIVLSKLGPNPSQNELLNELILLDDNSGLNEIEQTESASAGNVGATGTSGGAATQSCSGNLRHIVIDGSNIAMR